MAAKKAVKKTPEVVENSEIPVTEEVETVDTEVESTEVTEDAPAEFLSGTEEVEEFDDSENPNNWYAVNNFQVIIGNGSYRVEEGDLVNHNKIMKNAPQVWENLLVSKLVRRGKA